MKQRLYHLQCPFGVLKKCASESELENYFGELELVVIGLEKRAKIYHCTKPLSSTIQKYCMAIPAIVKQDAIANVAPAQRRLVPSDAIMHSRAIMDLWMTERAMK